MANIHSVFEPQTYSEAKKNSRVGIGYDIWTLEPTEEQHLGPFWSSTKEETHLLQMGLQNQIIHQDCYGRM